MKQQQQITSSHQVVLTNSQQKLQNLAYARKLIEQQQQKYLPHVYTPAEKAAISISCIIITFLIIFVPLYVIHPEYFRIGPAGRVNHFTIPPPLPPFSCGTIDPILGTPITNGLYIRKPFNQTDYVSIPNTENFLDLTATTGMGVSFWYRMPYYTCPTGSCASGGPFDTVPLWRRADNSDVLWEVDLLIYPVSTPGYPNPIKIKFSTPDQSTVFYATPPSDALVNLQSWHFFAYDIQLDTNRQTTAFDVWVDAISYDVVSAQEGGKPSLFSISAITLIGLSMGALSNVPFPTPVQLQDCNSLSYFCAPFSGSMVTSLYNAGQQNCSVAIGSGGFGTPNAGCWLLGQGDIPFILGYDSRTDQCVQAIFSMRIAIQTIN